MIAIFTVLVALPLGYLVRNRMAAYLAYGLAFAQIYTFQTATLVMEWVDGSDAAFFQPDSPPDPLGGAVGYFIVTTGIYLIGFGLVTLGHRLRSRRDRRHVSADLEPAR